LLQDKIEQSVQIGDGPIRMQAQLLWRLIQSVYPHGWIAVRLCAGRVPSTKRGEDDVALVELETIDAQLICPRILLLVDAALDRRRPVRERCRRNREGNRDRYRNTPENRPHRAGTN
jgi:hypothetical protein